MVGRAYNYLDSANCIGKEIIRKVNKLDTLRGCLMPGGVAYDRDKVQTSPKDRMADVTAEIVALEDEIARLKLHKAIMIIEIYNVIEQLPDESERTILNCYFIGGESITQVAGKVNYSRSGAYYILNRGIEHIDQMLWKERPT